MGTTALANLVASTTIANREYAFPTRFLRLKRIDLKLDGTNWVRAAWIDGGEVGASLGDEAAVVSKFTNANPYYTLRGDKIIILSGTITAVTEGIRYTFSESIVGNNASASPIALFNATLSTDIPSLPEPYQMGLVYYASKLYFQKIEETNRVREMDAEVEKIIARMGEFEPTEDFPRLKIVSDLDNYA